MKTKNLKLPPNITLSGPYYKFSSPYGHATLERDEWFVTKRLTKKEQKTEVEKILGSTCLGSIVKYRNRKDYVISNLYPFERFPSLQKAVNFLIKNEGKLVFCS